MIDKDGVSKLVVDGHEIGAHTHTHFTISKLSLNDLVLEDKTNFDYLQIMILVLLQSSWNEKICKKTN